MGSPSTAITWSIGGSPLDIPVYNVDTVAYANDDPNASNAAPSATAVPIQEYQEPPQHAAPAPSSTLDVIAPTNMQAGYQFNVEAGGKMLRVEVPSGGAVAGQRFAAIIRQQDGGVAQAATVGGQDNPHNIPEGCWRDDLCDCCKHGCCHAMCCLSTFCTTCAVGQIMTRLQLNWCATPLNGKRPAMTAFKVCFIITAIYHIIDFAAGVIVASETDDLGEINEDAPTYVEVADVVEDFVVIAFGIFTLIILVKTHTFIRNKYHIPAGCCGGCEDCYCSFWCAPCTTCQMGRHITDFNSYQAKCCSDTGLAPGVPEVV